jgi:beta-lactam-binding protein with PASTA domain
MSRGSIPVPDVLGLTFASAHSVGSAAGLQVLGYAPDGSPIARDSEGIVVEQDPPAHELTKAGRQLRLRVGRGDGGSKDPEPREPDPLLRSDFGDLSDPDDERELISV